MPKLDLKLAQKEIEAGKIWPFYWLYGPEKLKARELLKRIETAVGGGGGGLFGFGAEYFDGGDSNSSEVLEAALSPAFGGGTRLIVVRDAHALKNPEVLSPLLGPASTPASGKEDLMSVCVCLSKDLDARKKFSKQLVEKAAVVACEEVSEAQKDAWIQYLAKRKGLNLKSEVLLKLRILDPWSLDIVDQEIEKYSVASLSDSDADSVVLDTQALQGGLDGFLEHFFSRKYLQSLQAVSYFADQPDESLPLLGLLSWNTRQLAMILADRENGTRTAKLNPYLAEKLQRWSRHWSRGEILELQSELAELDFDLKQRPLMPLSLWSSWVSRFCQK